MTAINTEHQRESTLPPDVEAEEPDSPTLETPIVQLEEQGPSPRRARRRTSPTARVVAGILLMVSVLALWFLAYGLFFSGLQEHGAQARLYSRFRLELAAATAPIGVAIHYGAPVALLSAPSAGVHNAVVVEGTTSRQLGNGPGHLSDTPLPGQPGESQIFGRSTTFGGPFGDIGSMHQGAPITVVTGEGKFTFLVTGVRHPGSPLPPNLKTDQSRLTLVTSSSSGWRSGWAPDQVLYVDALLKGRALPAPQAAPSSMPSDALPMRSDSGALLPLALWLELLVVAEIAAVFAWWIWGKRQAWMVGLPTVLAVLWVTSGVLLRLIPNLV